MFLARHAARPQTRESALALSTRVIRTVRLCLKGMSDTLLAVGYRNCLPWKQSVNFYVSLRNPRQNQCLGFYVAISKATKAANQLGWLRG